MRLLDLRLAFRLQRFEIVGLGALVGVLSLAALVVAGNLDATGYGAHCSLADPNPPGCEAMGRAYYGLQQVQVPLVQGILVALPFLLGALVGAPLVARELERGTSRLVWSLAPSRTHWFVARVVPAVIVVFAVSFVAGAALDRLWAAISPGVDVANGFPGYGSRGVVLAARAAFVFAIGVTVGSFIGRVLPALIVTAVIAYVGITGGSYVHERILASEAVPIESPTGSTQAGNRGNLFVSQRVRLPDGRTVTWEALDELYPPAADGAVWPPEGVSVLDMVVPAARYRQVELREVGALAGASAVALGIAAVAVRRRRPG